MTICIQCALEAFAAGEPLDCVAEKARFEETPEEHRRRVHPDLNATNARRRELNRLAAARMGGTLIEPDNN